MREKIEVGYQAFVSDGDEAFGAVKEVVAGLRPNTALSTFAGNFTARKISASDNPDIKDCNK